MKSGGGAIPVSRCAELCFHRICGTGISPQPQRWAAAACNFVPSPPPPSTNQPRESITPPISPATSTETSLAGGHETPRLNILNAELIPDVNINYPFPNALNIPSRRHIPNISIAGGWAGVSDNGFPFHASDGAETLADD